MRLIARKAEIRLRIVAKKAAGRNVHMTRGCLTMAVDMIDDHSTKRLQRNEPMEGFNERAQRNVSMKGLSEMFQEKDSMKGLREMLQ